MNRRVFIIAIATIVVLAAILVGAWSWLRQGGPRPLVEVVVAEAPIKLGEEVLATAAKGERLAVHGKQTGWYQVRAGRRGQLGWISAAHVRRVLSEERAARKEVQVEMLGVYFPDMILDEPPPWDKRWVLVEVNAFALKGKGQGGCPLDTHRFVLTYGKKRFFRPRLVKTIPVGDHTIERLENREVLDMPVGSSRRFRLAFAVPSDCATHTGWRIYYVRFKPKTPDTASPASR